MQRIIKLVIIATPIVAMAAPLRFW